MEIKQALALLEVSNIYNIDKKDIKKKWKIAIKKAHPDVGGNDMQAALINEAYKLLTDYVEYLSINKGFVSNGTKSNIDVCILELRELIDIYNGKAITKTVINSNDNLEIELSKENIASKRIIIVIPITIESGSLRDTHKLMAIRSMKDEYNVDLQLGYEGEIKVRLYEKSIKYVITETKIQLRFKLDCGIVVNIHCWKERV